MKRIILAGGCFWGVEAYFERVKGISKTVVGYIDGMTEDPTYQEVCRGSGHAEAVWLEYEETVIDLTTILKHFFRIIDPTQYNRQGHDIGKQYRSAIYYESLEDKMIAENFIESIRKNYQKPIRTVVVPATRFYEAEEYHQKYLDKNPSGYCHVDLNLLKEELE